MKVKIRWLIGILCLCLISAVFTAMMTVLLIVRGAFSQEWLRSIAGEQRSSAQTLATQTTPPTTSLTEPPAPSPQPTPTPTPRPTEPTLPAEALLNLVENHERITAVYEQVAPSVVGINVAVTGSGSTTTRTNQGTGLIIDKTGLIVTNTSTLAIALDREGKLVEDASLDIWLADGGKSLPATLVGRDQMTGLSVIAIKPGDRQLQAATLAEYPNLKVGQIVLSCGYPDILSEAGVLISGIISGINRWVSLEDGTQLQMIQTDAHMAQSSSGGPLLNLDGEVIGLANSTILRESYDSLGYALPAGVVSRVVKDLTSQPSESDKAWLGVAVLNEQSFLELQALYQWPDGLYVSSVIKDSPAYIAGLRKGDIITRFDGQDIDGSETLATLLTHYKAGDSVDLKVYRKSDGLYHDLKVYLQEYEH